MMHHSVFTFVMKVDPGRCAQLESVLNAIQKDRDGNPYLRFKELGCVHFASFTIFPPDDTGEFEPCSGPPREDRRHEPVLVFENNIDGPIPKYVDLLLDKAFDGMKAIVMCCSDTPATLERAVLRKYLLDHVVKAGAYHIGTPWRPVKSIQDEARLRVTVEAEADKQRGGWKSVTDAREARARIQEVVKAQPDLDFAKKPERPPSLWDKWGPRIGPIVNGIVALVPFALAWAIVTLTTERTDCEWKGAVDEKLLDALGEREDKIAQNHMCNMNDVKSGWIRQMTMRGILCLANLVARFSTSGTLSGIPSIHFAHWSLLDGGKRLLFLSNFDGSWENYLDDFIDKANKGLTGIWSNTWGFPRAYGLLWGGATNAERFKAIARQKQVPARVFFSAYKGVTVKQVFANAAIRKDLYTNLDADGARAWLRNL